MERQKEKETWIKRKRGEKERGQTAEARAMGREKRKRLSGAVIDRGWSPVGSHLPPVGISRGPR